MSPAASPLIRPPVASTRRRILVIDDSVVARVMLSKAFEDAPDFEVCASFDRAARALDWLAVETCDLVLLDLELPGRSGIAALPDLIAASGRARIVIVSSAAADGAAATLQALSLGVADAIAKPAAGPIGRQFGIELIARLRGLASEEANVRERPAPVALRETLTTPIGCVGIGASTGGINALAALIGALPRDFAAPILVTQHLPAPFLSFFADQLASVSSRSCVVARDGDVIGPQTILLAPGDGHLSLVREGNDVRVSILDHSVASRCMPSVDPMLEAIGDCYGAAGVGIVLSGMGRDGCDGARALVDYGGSVIVQDSETATIWGMPGSVARAGLASLIAPPERIAEHLTWRGSAR